MLRASWWAKVNKNIFRSADHIIRRGKLFGDWHTHTESSQHWLASELLLFVISFVRFHPLYCLCVLLLVLLLFFTFFFFILSKRNSMFVHSSHCLFAYKTSFRDALKVAKAIPENCSLANLINIRFVQHFINYSPNNPLLQQQHQRQQQQQ